MLRPALAMLLCATVAAASGPMQPLPQEAKAPLLHIRFAGPAGMAATIFDGAPQGRTFDAPVAAGFRPGCIYRLRLHGMRDFPNLSLYPSLEVRDTLRLPPRLRSSDYPALVTFTDDDVQKVLDGAMITRVVVVENAENAADFVTSRNQPIEVTVGPGEDAVNYARSFGRVVLIVRLGMREPEREALRRQPRGQILTPGQKALPPAPPRPMLPAPYGHLPSTPGLPMTPHNAAAAVQCCTPNVPSFPSGTPVPNECIRDGGDAGKPIHFNRWGNLQGLEPADTAATYVDAVGRKRLAVTNALYLCVPRFIVVKQSTAPFGHEAVTVAGTLREDQAHGKLQGSQDARSKRQLDETYILRDRKKPVADIGAVSQSAFRTSEGLQAHFVEEGMGRMIGSAQMAQFSDKQKFRFKEQVEFAIRLSQQVGAQGVEELQPGCRAVGRIDEIGTVNGVLETRTGMYLCPHEQPVLPDQPLQVYKWASTGQAQIGDIITLYVRYTNLGSKPVQDLAVTDSLSARLEYVAGSAQADREAIFVTQKNDAGSLILRWEIRDALEPNQTGVVSFKAKVK